MSKSKIVIGDVHGELDTLKALIKKLPHKDIVFVGDLVDRGPDSCGVIEYIRKNKWDVIKGNHEEMMVSDEGLWMSNGGKETVESYVDKNGILNDEKLQEHINWMKNLPFFKIYKNVKDNKNRVLVVTHSMISSSDWHDIKMWRELDGVSRGYLYNTVIWNRRMALLDNPVKGVFNVFGHTPTLSPVVKEGRALIDTGACYGDYLTAFQYPEMKIYTQEKVWK